MNRTLKTTFIILIILVLVLMIPVFMDSKDFFDKRANAEDAGWSEVPIGGGTGGPGATPIPTPAPSVFTILEIVPYKGMGEIGYLVGGEEPVNEELFTKDNAVGDLSFLGGAITPYNSYLEKPIPASGTQDSGYIPIKTYYTQNGYFEYLGTSNGGVYQKVTGQDVYTRVADGLGSYNAKLGTENTSIYTSTWNQTNDKNVNAYFVLGKPTGVPLAHTAYGYEPGSVTKNATHTGDYDYNSATKTFYLNKGHGKYNVIFLKSYSTTNLYYMMADYTIVDDFTGTYSWSLTYTNVGATGGNYKKETNGMTFNYQLNNSYNYCYKWVQSDLALSKPSNYYQEGATGAVGTNAERIWVRGQKFEKTYEYTFNVTLVNNEWFKRLTLGLSAADCDNFKVDVVTMTPTDLNKPENQHYLSDASIFYINDKATHNWSYISLYENKSYEGLALPASSKYNSISSTLNFGLMDLNWSGTMKIFKRVTGVNSDGSLGGFRAAVVFDDTFFQHAIAGSDGYGGYKADVTVNFSWNSTGASVCNLAKLYIMLYQRDPVKFYKAFLAPTAPRKITEVATNRNATGSTGSFVRPDSTAIANSVEATFWNGNTFCAYVQDATTGNLVALNINNAADKLIIEKEIPNYNITAQTTDLNANVLVMNGQDIFTAKFIEPIGSMPADALDEKAKIYAASNNGGVVPSSYNLFSFIDMISYGGTGYESTTTTTTTTTDTSGEDGMSGSNLRTYTSVLNIEPTADYTASDADIKKILEGYNLVIVHMTSEEFNSSIVDINTHFDMIYIGASAGRFNMVSSNTVFNKAEDIAGILDDNLNNSVYNKGDRIITSEGTKNYTGNDLSTKKIADLTEFIAAGYPIVMENSIYTLSTAVHSSTNLFSFIQTTKANSANTNLMNAKDYDNSKIAFLGKLSYAIKIARPMIQMVEPIVEDTATVNYIYVDPVTKILNIQFALVPAGLVANSALKYNAYLYMDYNEDGIFTESERLNPVPRDGSSSNGITESKFTSYVYSYNMANYNGVYQWQVKVVKQYTDGSGITHDTPIRSEITGFAASTNKKTIQVLQITDNATDTTAYSLENKVNDSASLIRKYGGLGSLVLKDYDLVFKTMSVAQFLQQYQTEPYTLATDASTNKLAGYHVIIMDNQIDQITDAKGALSNVKNEISKGIGVIFTRGAINYSNQANYLPSNNLLFDDQKTYPRLTFIGKTLDAYLHPTDDPYYIFNFGDYGLNETQLKAPATYQTTFITKSNIGSDSEYPYKIGEAIKISASSYVEDAAIDYNKNMAIPLIGWYCLSDSRSPKVRALGLVSDTTANTYTGIYSSSPNDVKNNYYLFNRGKIYFSGIQFNTADVQYNDEEIKLFINTLVASYKTSGRIIIVAPAIAITDPTPISNTISLTTTDVGSKTEIPITFNIANSSSNFTLSVLWNDLSTTTGNWNKSIYKVESGGALTPVTNLANVANGTYVVKIPVTELEGNHKLTINAVNLEGRATNLNTTITYTSLPITVKIDNTDLVKNVDKGEQYLYIDIDYAKIDNPDAYLSNSSNIKLEFTVTNASTNASITIKDSSDNDGNPNNDPIINTVDDLIHVVGDPTTTYNLTTGKVPNGSYYVSLWPSVMSSNSSKDVTFTATNDSTHGSTTVTLLRRSLFQLD